MKHLRNLIKLPTSIGNLINLRYLDISGDGLKIKDLRDMSHLKGEICISKLEKVENIQDARNANLNTKHNLEGLTMKWNVELNDSQNGIHEMDVLDSLQPHSNLNKLSIVLYDGPKFPRWIMDASFSKMVYLSLINFQKCTSLPCLGQSPLLKNLLIQGMNGVKKVGVEFYGATCLSNKPFPSLESLQFACMSAWEDWEKLSLSILVSFPCLQELRLGFPLPRLPSICELHTEECNEVFLPMLQVLQISECGELTYFRKNGFGLENLAHLQQLEISSCPQLVSLEEDKEQGHPCNLQYLRIEHCDKLEKLPNVWQYLTCLEELEIKDCPNLMSFPEMGFPPMLRRLSIQIVKLLRQLPNGALARSTLLKHSALAAYFQKQPPFLMITATVPPVSSSQNSHRSSHKKIPQSRIPVRL
ncbi:putative disease resistance RPP13-like protein 1 [Vitis vinifera]|uniref:Putative disease resistance RPP13-like protein 1 n=1 Tax=Vitis vinifera TaxID=29760 RepID=A0A438CHL5_VITVI|nr:putative disease resistance RPP13-like protein 1 [Vitis vinifera]